MPRFTQEQKDAAFRNQERALNVVGAAGIAAAAAPLIPVAGIFVAIGVATVGAAIAWRGSRQGRIVRDPERDDFHIETTLEPARFNIDGFGGSGVEVAAADFVRVSDELARLFEAIVVAVERAAGAEQAAEPGFVQARAAEALAFAERASGQLYSSSDHARALAETLQEYADVDFPPSAPPSPGDKPVQQLIDALVELGEADAEYAGAIQEALRAGSFLEGLEGMGNEPVPL